MGSDQNGPITAATYDGSSTTDWASAFAFDSIPFDVQADHLGDHRQVPPIDRLLERELQTEERGSHRLRGPGNRHVVQERDLHGHGVGRGRRLAGAARARGGQGRDQGDQNGGGRGASAHVGSGRHARGNARTDG